MKIKINGIFGKYNSEINLDNKCTIFIGENGCGKSTTLKILNYILQGDFINITKYNFESIELKNNTNVLKIFYEDFLPKFEIFKSQLKLQAMETDDTDMEFVKKIYLNKDIYFDKYDIFLESKLSEDDKKRLNDKVEINLDAQIFLEIYQQMFFEEMAQKGFSNKTKRLLKEIEENYNILTFSTLKNDFLRLISSMQKNVKNVNGYKFFYNSKFEESINEIKNYIIPDNKMFKLNMYNTYLIKNEIEYIVTNDLDDKLYEMSAFENIDVVSKIEEIKKNIVIENDYNLFNDINLNNSINISKLCFLNYFENINIEKILNELYEEAKEYLNKINSNVGDAKEIFGDEISDYFFDLDKNNIALNNVYDWFISPMLPKFTVIDVLPKKRILKIFYNNLTKENYDNKFEETLLYAINDKIKTAYTLINTYITNKKVFTTPSGLKISNSVEYDENGVVEISDDINFEFLSEGEKRLILIILISVFSDNAIIVLDEPETSLSLIWQENLIPDLLKNTKVKNIIVATQSPYITNDESLSDCISCIIGDDN